jgi:hypothetical protein
MNTIEIEVTLLETTKVYTVNPVEVTGIEDKAVALLALRQAFIAAGKPLATANLLKRHPAPQGIKQADWLKGLEGSVQDNDFPTPEEVWTEGQAKALKAYEPSKSGSATKVALNDALALIARMQAELAALKGQ